MQHPQPALTNCKNCGETLHGEYCSECGEKVYSSHDKTFAHVVEEFFHFITHFDSKFFTTLYTVFRWPGLVSLDYCEGRRSKYFKPVSLFLVGVVIYLIFPLIQGMNISFRSHISQWNHMHLDVLQQWVNRKLAHEHVSLEAFGEHFDTKSPKISKFLLPVLLPLTAGALALIQRGKQRFYFDHLMLSAEFNSFFLYFNSFFVPLILTIVIRTAHAFAPNRFFGFDDSILFPVMMLGALLFCTVSFRRFYGNSFGSAIGRSLLFLGAYIVISLIIYRLLLFTIVMLFI
jgi:Protein of unknown function (DUF3667)